MNNQEDLDKLKSMLSNHIPVMTEEDYQKDSKKLADNLGDEHEIISNKQLRKDIDETIQILSSLPKSREIALAITKLEEGVMWLGMDLKRLGAKNPYPSSKDPNTGNTIEPTADGLKFSS